jgi:hypothetical protein
MKLGDKEFSGDPFRLIYTKLARLPVNLMFKYLNNILISGCQGEFNELGEHKTRYMVYGRRRREEKR